MLRMVRVVEHRQQLLIRRGVTCDIRSAPLALETGGVGVVDLRLAALERDVDNPALPVILEALAGPPADLIEMLAAGQLAAIEVELVFRAQHAPADDLLQ